MVKFSGSSRYTSATSATFSPLESTKETPVVSPPEVTLTEENNTLPNKGERRLQVASYPHEDLPNTVLIHKCTIEKMRELIDRFRVYGDPASSAYDQEGKLTRHAGRSTTIINKSGAFIKTYTKQTPVGKPLFGLILNHENMVTLLASSRNLASHSEYRSDRVDIKGKNANYKHRNFFTSRRLINYDVEHKSLSNDTASIMEKYHQLVEKHVEDPSVAEKEKLKTKKNGKVILPNEFLVAKKNDDKATCIGIFVDLVSHDNMTKASPGHSLQKKLMQRFASEKFRNQKKSIFERCFQKNMTLLQSQRNEFDTLKAVCRNYGLNFYARNLDVDGKPQLIKIDLESMEDFDSFLLACEHSSSPQPMAGLIDPAEKEVSLAREGAAMGKQTDEATNSDIATQNNEKPLSVSKYFDSPPREWCANLATLAGKYFNKPYTYTTHKTIESMTKEIGAFFRNDMIRRRINGVEYTVFRRKHGLAHGMRQCYLALDIVEACAAMKKSSSGKKEVEDIANWVIEKNRNDPHFIKKLQFVAAFQRSGRESEVSGKSNAWKIYNQRDAKNFLEVASTEGNPFDNDQERLLYAESILEKGTIDVNTNTDLVYLRKILTASHFLDLRRIMHFSEDRLKRAIATKLFDDAAFDKEKSTILDKDVKRMVDQLWDRSGEYLDAVEDTDLVKQGNNKFKQIADAYGDNFFIFSNDPQRLVHALHEARETSKIKF